MSEETTTPIRPEDIIVDPPQKDIEGVKYEVAVKITKMLEDGRRYFGSSGASLTQQAFNPAYADKGINAGLAKIGLDGERDTTFFLKKWIKDKPGAVLVDSVHIKGFGKEEVNEETGMIEGGDTDHVLFIGSEVILVDTKRWKSKKNYSVGDNGEALRTNKPFGGGNLHMRQALHIWLNYLDEDASVTGIVCINAEEVTVFRNRNWYTQSYRLVELARFEELLNEKWKMIDDHDKTHINSTLVSQAVVGCQKPYDAYERVFAMKTLEEFR
jgi:hypothetical protein